MQDLVTRNVGPLETPVAMLTGTTGNEQPLLSADEKQYCGDPLIHDDGGVIAWCWEVERNRSLVNRSVGAFLFFLDKVPELDVVVVGGVQAYNPKAFDDTLLA